MQCSLLPMCYGCYYVNIANLNEADGDGRRKKNCTHFPGADNNIMQSIFLVSITKMIMVCTLLSPLWKEQHLQELTVGPGQIKPTKQKWVHFLSCTLCTSTVHENPKAK